MYVDDDNGFLNKKNLKLISQLKELTAIYGNSYYIKNKESLLV